jgi:hypothetical protein
MVVKYVINNEVLTDRNSLCSEFNLSKTKLHNLISKVNPSVLYRGFYLYKYDEIQNHLKNNEDMIETLD